MTLTWNSAFIGCWVSDPCNYYFGRRGVCYQPPFVLSRVSADRYTDHLFECDLLLNYSHRWRCITDMGAIVHHSLTNGNWYGLEGLFRSYLCRRELTGEDSRRSSHVMADVDRYEHHYRHVYAV